MNNPFFDDEHQNQYLKLLSQLPGRDNGYKALVYVLTAPRMKKVRNLYVSWRKDDTKTLDDLWIDAGVLSHAEQILLRVAMNLYSASGAVDLSQVCDTLDAKSFILFQRALQVYRGQLPHG